MHVQGILIRMNKNAIIAIVVIIVLLIGGYFVYSSTMSSPSTEVPNNGTATTTDQVQAQEITAGTGREATPGSVVSVLYEGRLEDGTVFDSSAAHGNQPLVFTLGEPGLIPGFQIGVNGMKEGGERAIAVPASLGYGDQAVTDASGKTIIPANATIVFRIKLVSVQDATSTPAQQ